MAVAGRGHDVGDESLFAGRVLRARTTAASDGGAEREALSISPSSMRKPRSLTWWSMRPRNSSVPSGVQRARSPVRYMRAPGRGRERIGDEALGGELGAAEVAAGDAVAADVELAGDADRDGLAGRRRGRRAAVLSIGRPMVIGPAGATRAPVEQMVVSVGP